MMDPLTEINNRRAHEVFVVELEKAPKDYVGIACGNNVDVNAFEQLIKTADERMYEDKKIFYQTSGKNRRTR